LRSPLQAEVLYRKEQMRAIFAHRLPAAVKFPGRGKRPIDLVREWFGMSPDRASRKRTPAELRHDFNGATHLARVSLRALRASVKSRDDLELLDGIAKAVNDMAGIFTAVTE
jgi:hypothetical protein